MNNNLCHKTVRVSKQTSNQLGLKWTLHRLSTCVLGEEEATHANFPLYLITASSIVDSDCKEREMGTPHLLSTGSHTCACCT